MKLASRKPGPSSGEAGEGRGSAGSVDCEQRPGAWKEPEEQDGDAASWWGGQSIPSQSANGLGLLLEFFLSWNYVRYPD